MTKRLLLGRTILYGVVVLAGLGYCGSTLKDVTRPDPRQVVQDASRPWIEVSVEGATVLNVHLTHTEETRTITVRVTGDGLRVGETDVAVTVHNGFTADCSSWSVSRSEKRVETSQTRYQGQLVSLEDDYLEPYFFCSLKGEVALAAENASEIYYTFPGVSVVPWGNGTARFSFTLNPRRTDEPVLLNPPQVSLEAGGYTWVEERPVREWYQDVAGANVIPEARFRDPAAAASLQWRLFLAALVLGLVASLMYAIADAWLVYVLGRGPRRNMRAHRAAVGVTSPMKNTSGAARREVTGTGWPD